MAKAKNYKPKAKKSRKGPIKITPNFKKAVQKVNSEGLEDKQTCLFPEPSVISNNINATTDLRRLIPDILTGTSDYQRIGDNIRGKSLIIRGHLELGTNPNLQNSDGPTRIIVRLMVLSDKRISAYENQSLGFLNNLIDFGSGTVNMDGSVGGANNLRSMYLPIDRNTATVHYDKLFYLNAPRIFNSTGTQLQNVNYENTIKLFKISVKCKKLLRYADGQNTPTNFAPYLTGCCFQLNGGGTGITNLARLHYTTTFTYEDP